MQVRFFDLGLVNFKTAWDFQKEIFSKVKNNEFNAALIFCRHYPVITLGRNTDKNHILAKEGELKKEGISVYEIERGGDVTYHGPGQLIVYPVFNLNYFKKDIALFLRNLEEVAIMALADFSLLAKRRPGLTGVWCKDKKIASIGIAIRNWITYHGLSINIEKGDLRNFSLIRPCGMDIMMASMETILNKKISLDKVKKSVLRAFQAFLGASTMLEHEEAPLPNSKMPLN